MKAYSVFQVDSFTREKFSGNPAGVVLNADGLTEKDMLNIARELNNSETAFFFSPTEPGYDGELRYFTPKTEVPTCGHATIAALYAKAVEERRESCVLRIKTKVGILPMEIAKRRDDYYISMTQGKFEISEPLEADIVRALLEALGLEQADLDARCPIQIASTGHSKVLIGIRERTTLNALAPDNGKLIELSKRIKCNGYYVFTFDSGAKDALTEGRMFAPAIGIAEDPVTGNANGPLGAYMICNKLAPCEDGVFAFTGYQGEAVKRPGRIAVEVTVRDGKPERVKIGGQARIVFKTEIEV